MKLDNKTNIYDTMKLISLTRDTSSIISLNKPKDVKNIKSLEQYAHFIHKKNPAKGRLDSYKLLGPMCRTKKNNLWALIYLKPQNKTMLRRNGLLIGGVKNL